MTNESSTVQSTNEELPGDKVETLSQSKSLDEWWEILEAEMRVHYDKFRKREKGFPCLAPISEKSAKRLWIEHREKFEEFIKHEPYNLQVSDVTGNVLSIRMALNALQETWKANPNVLPMLTTDEIWEKTYEIANTRIIAKGDREKVQFNDNLKWINCPGHQTPYSRNNLLIVVFLNDETPKRRIKITINPCYTEKNGTRKEKNGLNSINYNEMLVSGLEELGLLFDNEHPDISLLCTFNFCKFSAETSQVDKPEVLVKNDKGYTLKLTLLNKDDELNIQLGETETRLSLNNQRRPRLCMKDDLKFERDIFQDEFDIGRSFRGIQDTIKFIGEYWFPQQLDDDDDSQKDSSLPDIQVLVDNVEKR